MLMKDPVRLDDSIVEIAGKALDFDWLTFWSDTFRHADLLQYQNDDDVQMMFTGNTEKTTYELTLKTTEVPDYITEFWKTGERFAINVENEYFDLSVDNARVAQLQDDMITIVAEIKREGLASAT